MATTNDDIAVEGIEYLSNVIIETLKELSSNRQPLSKGFLCKALAKRQEILDLLQHGSQGLGLSVEGSKSESSQPDEVRARAYKLQEDDANILSEIAVLREQNLKIQDFCRRSLLTLLVLVRGQQKVAFAESLERFKNGLKGEMDLEGLENSLRTLKEIVFKEDLEGEKERDGKPGRLGGWLRRKKPAREVDLAADVYLKQLQDGYSEIVSEFYLDIGKEYIERFNVILQRVKETENLDQLLALNGEILSLIKTYTRIMHDERTQVTHFITEIGTNLIEMEKHFLASLKRTSQAHEANASFNSMLDGEMEEIKDSARLSKTLAEFKSLVVSKLSAIKVAMETKQKEDEHLLEEANREMKELESNLRSMRAEIKQVQEKSKTLEMESLLDPLTGIHNRRAYRQRLSEELQRYHRYRHVFSLVLFDVDHFKRVNDQYGHLAGDKCLKEIVKRVEPVLREADFLARYGGEEFIVILPGTEQESAFHAAERLRSVIEKTRFLYRGEAVPLTISLGVTQVQATDQSEEALFSRVDKAVYEAKNRGRNRAVLL